MAYHCIKCKASEIGKPVSKKREEVHTEFRQLLSNIRPDEGTAKLFKEIILRRWSDAYKESRELTKNLNTQIEEGLTRKSRLTDLYLDNKIGEEEYNEKKDELDYGLTQLRLRYADANTEVTNKEQVIDDALLFMSDPGLYWNQAPLEIKKRVQDSIFPEGLTYDPTEGFGTVKLAESYLLIKKIASEEAKNPNLVAASGVEPLTSGL